MVHHNLTKGASKLPLFYMVVILVLIIDPSIGIALSKRSIRLCGTDLANALKTVCRGRYYKRSAHFLDATDYDSDDSRDLGFNDNGSMLSLYNRYLRSIGSSRGVAAECCHESCDINTLFSYCGGPKPTTPAPY